MSCTSAPSRPKAHIPLRRRSSRRWWTSASRRSSSCRSSDFAGKRNWGYDGVLPYAPDSAYGQPEELKALIDAAHGAGLMVLLDVVYNHFGPKGNYLPRYAPQFFTEKHKTPWGAAIDFSQPTVRQYFVHNVLYWLEEYRFDGLRFDAVHAIIDESPNHILDEICASVPVESIWCSRTTPTRRASSAPGAIPRSGTTTRTTATTCSPPAKRTATTSPTPMRRPGIWRAAWPKASPTRARSRRFSKEPRGEPSAHLPPSCFVDFLQNHDQVGNRAFGERIAQLSDERRLKALSAIHLLAPSPPLLFMGEEWGCQQPFLFFCDFDGELGEAVRKGRREEFSRFASFKDSIPDPLAESTFRQSVLDWNKRDAGWLAHYKKLLQLRARAIAPRKFGPGKYRMLGERAFEVKWDGLTLLANCGDQKVDVKDAPRAGCAVVERQAGRGVVGELVDQRVNRHPREGGDEIASSYLDVWGNEKQIDPDVRAALAKAMGPARRPSKLEVEPGACYQPDVLQQKRLWGFMVQLYGLRSERNWGIGDFTDLRNLADIAAELGAGVIGVNPLHATQGSPYSPSSRHALNVLYIDVEALPGFESSDKLRKRLRALRESELVDYEGVRQAKLEALEAIFKKTKPKVQVTGSYPVFEALREKFGGGWQSWPKQYQNPGSPAVKAFAKKNASRVAFHAWLQQLARGQLEAVQRHTQELGMPLGLYVDLALGADRGGAEVWADQDAFAVDASCGAPPDEFNPRGQDWGLPPYSPRALRAKAYRPFIDLLRANMPVGGALRMDHVMALSRLWWIPQGAKPERGGYVNYPFRELLAVLAAESRRARCLVVGEDLGTVPAELRSALNEAGVLSYRPLLFEKNAQGEFCAPEAYPREALVCVSTHDLPTWRGYWDATDLKLRQELGLTVDFQKEMESREGEKKKLEKIVDRSAQSAHAFIARTPAKLAMLQPEDVFELLEQANLPGTVDQHPNWRRKLPLALEAGAPTRGSRRCGRRWPSAACPRARRWSCPSRRTACSSTRISASRTRSSWCRTSPASASAISTRRRSSRRAPAARTATT